MRSTLNIPYEKLPKKARFAFTGYHRARFLASGINSIEVKKEEVIKKLEIKKPLEKLLDLPETLLVLERELYTSEKSKINVSSLINFFFFGAGQEIDIPTIPESALASFSIGLVDKGSDTFAGLIDMRRKIIVLVYAGSIFSNEMPSISVLEPEIRKALEKVKELEEKGEEFKFVWNEDGKIYVIKEPEDFREYANYEEWEETQI